MQTPQIRIQSTPAKLGLTIQNAKHTYKQPKAEQHIEQPKAEVSIKQQPPKLSIDQTKAWKNIGLKSVFVRSEEYANHAKQKGLENIASIAQEGDELMRIESGGNPIASQAKRMADQLWEFNIQPGGSPAYDLVAISFKAGGAMIDVQRNEPILKATKRDPEFQYELGQVAAQIEQYSDVKIDFENLRFKAYRFETNI
ncbi:hypothetical protein N780_19425 [Pontibacillus chungwhensis BH030062]|uniref:Uncharacterized protein n=1 Tax=Pontibacillus chungwhensis BH030062 TaxID=1385513 RepID=A0A0A2USZ6_9BACI|nr:DUF6470 family protein [Pontibacillus chungwhensis]KGP91402.1 hypothetical protein N780_19425 [Pontibacillus chungwhensis BH030062]